MIRQPIGRPEQLLLGAASLLFVVIAYGCLSYGQHLKNPTDKTMPNLSQFVEGWKKMALPKTGKEAWAWKDLWPPASRVWLVQDAWATYGRLVVGMVVGVLAASVIGVAMGCFAWVESLFLPVLNFFAKIPPTAMLAVYFIVFGVTFKMYVAMVALGIAPNLTQSIYQAAKKDVSDHAIFKAYTLGASHLETIWNVVCRQILPRAMENIRLQVGLAMVFLIAAEMLVAEVGFGYQLRMQSRLQNMNVVYSYLIILGVTGLLIDWGLSSWRRKLCRWFGD